MKKYALFAAVIAACMLASGCGDNAEQSEASVQTEESTSAVTSQTEQSTTALPPKDTIEVISEEERLKKLVLESVASDSAEMLQSKYGDFDGDGIEELITAVRRESDSYDGKNYYRTSVWFASGDTATELYCSESHLKDVRLGEIRQYKIGGDALFMYDELRHGITDIWRVSDSAAIEVEKQAPFGACYIRQDSGAEFVGITIDYDAVEGMGGATEKTYPLHYDAKAHIMTRYAARECTIEELCAENPYAGRFIDELKAEGRIPTSAVFNGSGQVMINYYIEQGMLSENHFRILDMNSDELYRSDLPDGDGIYRVEVESYEDYVLEEPDSAEYLRLKELTESAIEPDSELLRVNFGDFDGDGIEELISVYGVDVGVQVWFASGENAEKISTSFDAYTPLVMYSADGEAILRTLWITVTDNHSTLYAIRNSGLYPITVEGFATMSIHPTQSGKGFIGYHSTYDCSSDGTGHSWKPYWFTYDPDTLTMHQCYGDSSYENRYAVRSYEGGAEILDGIEESGAEIKNITIFENGVICINLQEQYADEYSYSFRSYLIREDNSLLDMTYIMDDGYYIGEYDTYALMDENSTYYACRYEQTADYMTGEEFPDKALIDSAREQVVLSEAYKEVYDRAKEELPDREPLIAANCDFVYACDLDSDGLNEYAFLFNIEPDFDNEAGDERTVNAVWAATGMNSPYIGVICDSKGNYYVCDERFAMNAEIAVLRYNGFAQFVFFGGVSNNSSLADFYSYYDGEFELELREFNIYGIRDDVFLVQTMAQTPNAWLILWNDEIKGYVTPAVQTLPDSEEIFEQLPLTDEERENCEGASVTLIAGKYYCVAGYSFEKVGEEFVRVTCEETHNYGLGERHLRYGEPFRLPLADIDYDTVVANAIPIE